MGSEHLRTRDTRDLEKPARLAGCWNGRRNDLRITRPSSRVQTSCWMISGVLGAEDGSFGAGYFELRLAALCRTAPQISKGHGVNRYRWLVVVQLTDMTRMASDDTDAINPSFPDALERRPIYSFRVGWKAECDQQIISGVRKINEQCAANFKRWKHQGSSRWQICSVPSWLRERMEIPSAS